MLSLPGLSTYVEWQCPDCRTVLSRPPADDLAPPDSVVIEPRRCRTCELAAIEQAELEAGRARHRLASRAEVLRAGGCPVRFLVEAFDENRISGGWPRHSAKDDPAKHLVDLRQWNGRPYATLVIASVVGVGKTMLATELLWRAWQRGRSILWIRADQLVQRVYGNRDPDLLFRVVHAEAALIDDLGRGYSGDAWKLLDSVVAQRHQTQRQTVFTTNSPLASGPASLYALAPALADRLYDGLFVKLPSGAGSQRGASA